MVDLAGVVSRARAPSIDKYEKQQGICPMHNDIKSRLFFYVEVEHRNVPMEKTSI
jgi:hypothetical protein